MDVSFGRGFSDAKISSQSRAALAVLRPAGIQTFPAGPQSVLEDLVRDAPGAMALFDRDLRHLEVSNDYCTHLRLSRIAMLGKTFKQLLSSLPEDFEQALSRAEAGEDVTLEESWIPSPELRSLHMTWRLRPWRKSRKRVGGIVLFLHDASTSLLLDEQQRNLSECDAKMETIHRSAARIAHDFNNTLLVIIGYSSLLMEELRPEPTLGPKAASIYRAAERASKLADELLALSHSEI